MFIFLLFKIVAVQLVWIACVPVYCTAKQQLLLDRPIPKKTAWTLFALAVASAQYLLCLLYHPLTSAIYVLCVIMAAWIALALWLPYERRPAIVLGTTATSLLLLSLAGGAHVG